MKIVTVKFMDGDSEEWVIKDGGMYSVSTDNSGRNLTIYNPKTSDGNVTYDRISYPLHNIRYWLIK